MIYEEKRFMAVSEIEKECCTGCCFYDNGILINAYICIHS